MTAKKPGVYPESIDHLDRYRLKDWKDRIWWYKRDSCSITYSYRNCRLWRVGIWTKSRQLRRYFYGRQAQIVLTIWFDGLPKHKERSRQAEAKSTLPQTSEDENAVLSEGKTRGGR